LNVHEWKAVPDIWRTAAEKYPDLIAVIDPYHEPPTEWTYTQVRLWLQYEPLLMLDNFGLECGNQWIWAFINVFILPFLNNYL